MRVLGVLLLASLALADKKPDNREWVRGIVIGVEDRVVGSTTTVRPGVFGGEGEYDIRSRDRVRTFTIIETRKYLIEIVPAWRIGANFRAPMRLPVGAEVEVGSDGKRLWVRCEGKEYKVDAVKMDLKKTANPR